MAQTISLAASPRQATGKGGARQARFRGKVPAVIYGHGRDTQSLELEAKALEKALAGIEPASTIIELAVEGKAAVKTLIREIQRHPIRPDIIHVDFYEIHATEKVKLKVPVHLVGNPDGVRNAGQARGQGWRGGRSGAGQAREGGEAQGRQRELTLARRRRPREPGARVCGDAAQCGLLAGRRARRALGLRPVPPRRARSFHRG